jgi:hypothetical protein
MQKSNLPVRLVLVLVAGAHIVTGLVGVIPSVPLSIALVFYSGALQFSPQIAHLIHMFGVYMLTIGALCIYAIWDPVKHKSIIHGMIFLLLFRGIQRILMADQAVVVFGVLPDYYWIQTILFLLAGLALLWFLPKRAEGS